MVVNIRMAQPLLTNSIDINSTDDAVDASEAAAPDFGEWQF